MGIPVDYIHCVGRGGEGTTRPLVEVQAPWVALKELDAQLLRQPHLMMLVSITFATFGKLVRCAIGFCFTLFHSLVSCLLFISIILLLLCVQHILLKSKLTRIKIQAAEEMLFDCYNLLNKKNLHKYDYMPGCPTNLRGTAPLGCL